MSKNGHATGGDTWKKKKGTVTVFNLYKKTRHRAVKISSAGSKKSRLSTSGKPSQWEGRPCTKKPMSRVLGNFCDVLVKRKIALPVEGGRFKKKACGGKALANIKARTSLETRVGKDREGKGGQWHRAQKPDGRWKPMTKRRTGPPKRND